MFYFHSHHKCASRWAIAYLNDLAQRNFFDFAHDDRTDAVQKSPALMTFFGNSAYRRAVENEIFGVHFIRNPLNIIVSSYFSHLNTHPDGGWSELTAQRKLLQSANLQDGLHLTVDFLEREAMGPGTTGPLRALREWDYADQRFATIRIEDFVRAPSRFVKSFLPLSRPQMPPDWSYTFEAFSGGRAPGEINDKSHYRSGDPDEWRKYLPPSILAYVRSNFADLLSRHYPELLASHATAAA